MSCGETWKVKYASSRWHCNVLSIDAILCIDDQRTVPDGAFTRCSKRPANAFKMHVLMLDVCWKFARRLLDRVNTLWELRLSTQRRAQFQCTFKPELAKNCGHVEHKCMHNCRLQIEMEIRWTSLPFSSRQVRAGNVIDTGLLVLRRVIVTVFLHEDVIATQFNFV